MENKTIFKNGLLVNDNGLMYLDSRRMGIVFGGLTDIEKEFLKKSKHIISPTERGNWVDILEPKWYSNTAYWTYDGLPNEDIKKEEDLYNFYDGKYTKKQISEILKVYYVECNETDECRGCAFEFLNCEPMNQMCNNHIFKKIEIGTPEKTPSKAIELSPTLTKLIIDIKIKKYNEAIECLNICLSLSLDDRVKYDHIKSIIANIEKLKTDNK